jgi:putative ABC transport system permease protein
MSAVWSSARSAVRAHRSALAGSALVVALAAALLTATGAWVEAGVRAAAASADPEASTLIAVASSFAGTAVLIALFVVASTFAGALRPRAREFALLRAVGATTGQVRQIVTAEVLLVFAVAAPVGALPGLLLAPLLGGPLTAGGVLAPDFRMTPSPWPVLATLVLLLPTAVGAARMAGRESARLSPAGAVRGSAVEPTGLSRGRTTAAAVLAAAGLGTALVPFVLPGLLGSAAATVSAFLLIVAAALVGPVLLGWVARRGLGLRDRGAVGILALTNARGFSRRLTGAVVPLMLLLALGTVQSGVNVAVLDAAERQVDEALHADLVLTGDPAALERVAALPGVSAQITTVRTAQVRVDQDDEDLPFLDGLSWESAGLRTVPTDGDLVDPDVRRGSLADLAAVGTVAVSQEAAFGGTASVGDPVEVRVAGRTSTLTVVAVYERGLGLGDYLVGEATADRLGGEVGDRALLLRLDGAGRGADRHGRPRLREPGAGLGGGAAAAVGRAAARAAGLRSGRRGEHPGDADRVATGRARPAAPHRRHPPAAARDGDRRVRAADRGRAGRRAGLRAAGAGRRRAGAGRGAGADARRRRARRAGRGGGADRGAAAGARGGPCHRRARPAGARPLTADWAPEGRLARGR